MRVGYSQIIPYMGIVYRDNTFYYFYQGKAYELGQAVVMGMQGILVCWMRQSKHLENFKHKQVSENVKIKKNLVNILTLMCK